MPDTFRLGLQSHVRVAGLSVVLWSYQPLADVPQGFEVRDASAILPVATAQRLLAAGSRVAH
eukprot:15419627-Alexandrium_andersonii.AAC.1